MDQVNSGSTKAQAIFDEAVLYPNPYMVVTRKGYTKHYYAGTERIATVIGTGGFDDMVTTIDNLSSQHDWDIVKTFFTGKERDWETGYDYFGARYWWLGGTWLSVDPLADKYPNISPYAYCNWNPIKYVDPDGRSTKVVRNDDETYTVFGGDLNDGDLHIYEYTKDKDGNLIKGNSIGVSTSTTSFYDSDTKQWGGVINPQDESGTAFLGEIFNNKVSLFDYINNANTYQLYDFKNSNGTIEKSDDKQNMYRGMPICVNQNGEIVYSSARDIGNMAAGYIAGSNGISWGATRIVFDGLQSKQSKRLTIEGISSRNAQYLGWCMGYYNNSPIQQSRNTLRSFKSY